MSVNRKLIFLLSEFEGRRKEKGPDLRGLGIAKGLDQTAPLTPMTRAMIST